jgi:NTE family protein
MPFGSEGPQPGTGLALSGGGFRATLFHLGALWRLRELGRLQEVDRISSVSGGSLTSGKLALEWSALAAAGWTENAFVQRVVDPLRAFCTRDIDVPSVIKGALVPGKSIADFVAQEYDAGLFHGKTLQDLPDTPRFVFNSTNLATGVDFRFSKPYAGDYRIGLIEKPTIRVATAVGASSAFPPFLSPVELRFDPESFEKVAGADLWDDPSFRRLVKLTDGGVYDNLGLETVTKRCRTLFVSDAGAPFDYSGIQGSDWPRQALRLIDILTHQSWSLRLRQLIREYGKQHDGAYWGISTPIARFGTQGTLTVPVEVTRKLAGIRTRLNTFSEAEQCSLINWGYAICDASVRAADGPPHVEARWPYPAFALDRGVPAGVTVEPHVEPPSPPDAVWVGETRPDDAPVGGG